MVFSSLDFLLWFLPVFFISYFLSTNKYKNLIILLYSLFFYAYGNILHTIEYFFLIIISIIINYIFGLLIGKDSRFKYVHFSFAIIFNVSILFIFKYYNLFIKFINDFFIKSDNMKLIEPNIILPIGISFYTFQMLSYIIDVYRDKNNKEKNLINLSTYIIMFPQLIAGPIVKYSSIKNELKVKNINYKNILNGFYLFSIGLFYKVILANNLSIIWQKIHGLGYNGISSYLAWFGMYSFSFQLYFDFFGYSLMALGLGKIMGFTFPINFDEPYSSKSISEFWRRWNMTLGSWFREYIYIPLGGNRKGTFKTIINLFIVWFLTGLWHGASYNYVIWGMSLYLLILIDKFLIKKLPFDTTFLGRLIVILFVPFTFLIFAIENPVDLHEYLLRILNLGTTYGNSKDILQFINDYGKIFLLSILFMTPIPRKIYNFIKNKHLIMIPISIAIIVTSIYLIYIGLNDPFLYFRF